ncbi:tail fiber protein, partial [Escherichia coli]|nr:tail fiber protein [Escherichia coli]
GSALPVGVPIPWPSATPPTGWLKCNGAAFTASQYPNLALAYPALRLPDLRGEFIRGWDDGRGVDSGRVIGSAQGHAIQNIMGSLANVLTQNPNVFSGVLSFSGAGFMSLVSGGSEVQFRNITIDASRTVQTASETRPRNIAFNYIVRAA